MKRTFAIGSFVALAATVMPAAAQAPAPATPAAAGATAPVDPAAPLAALPPQGFTYTAEGRRDPFVGLLQRGSTAASATPVARAAGLAGLHTGEITLRGVLLSQGEYVAMVLGSDDKTYIVRPGDTLADGLVRAITADAMVVLQQVNDPLVKERQREVRKQLRRADATQ